MMFSFFAALFGAKKPPLEAYKSLVSQLQGISEIKYQYLTLKRVRGDAIVNFYEYNRIILSIHSPELRK